MRPLHPIIRISGLTIAPCSAFQIISFLPWLGRWALKLPQSANPIHILRKMANDNVMRRIKSGSHTRDLFHYLVRPSSLFCFFICVAAAR